MPVKRLAMRTACKRYHGGMKWTTLSRGGTLLLVAMTAFAQRRGLTALDFIEIQQLMNRYAMALDTGEISVARTRRRQQRP